MFRDDMKLQESKFLMPNKSTEWPIGSHFGASKQTSDIFAELSESTDKVVTQTHNLTGIQMPFCVRYALPGWFCWAHSV